MPPVDLPNIDDPELQPPNAKDLRLGLNPDAEEAIDKFAHGPTTEQDRNEVAGDFSSRGLGLGSGASKLPQPGQQPIEALEPIPLAEDEAAEEIFAPQLKIEPVEKEAVEQAVEPPVLDIAAINEAFALVGRSLVAFDAALSGTTAQLQLPNASSGEFTEDMKRAIIQTAEHTRRIAENSQSGGLVFG